MLLGCKCDARQYVSIHNHLLDGKNSASVADHSAALYLVSRKLGLAGPSYFLINGNPWMLLLESPQATKLQPQGYIGRQPKSLAAPKRHAGACRMPHYGVARAASTGSGRHSQLDLCLKRVGKHKD